MLPSKKRASKKDIDLLFKKGRIVNSPNMSFRFILDKELSNIKISFIAPKSVAKLAVHRNSLRRLGYNVLKKYIDQFPAGTLGVFVFKKDQKDFSVLENEIENILNKIN